MSSRIRSGFPGRPFSGCVSAFRNLPLDTRGGRVYINSRKGKGVFECSSSKKPFFLFRREKDESKMDKKAKASFVFTRKASLPLLIL